MLKFSIISPFNPSIKKFLINNHSSPTHWPHWNLIISKYFGSEFYYKVILHNNEIIGILPIHREKKHCMNLEYSGQYYYIPYGGWIFKEFSLNINSYLKNSYNTSITIFQIPYEPFNFHNDIENHNPSFKTLIIDLKKDINEIWNKEIDSKRRNMIRKAERNNIDIQITINTFSDTWYNLYLESCQRNNLFTLSKEFFIDLFNTSGELNFLIVNAYYNNNLLSNAIFAYDKFYSLYWLGSNSKSVNLGQSELIQWKAINKLKDFGCKFYDLCYIEKERLPQIYEFKKGFSKCEVTVPLIIRKPFLFRMLNKFVSWL